MAVLTLVTSCGQPSVPYDLVIRGGRVIDPETQLDSMRQVGIRGGRVEAVSEAPLEGRAYLDATGLVVAPGFIDLHSHAQNIPSAWLQAYDGVTTALELENGAWPVADSYRRAVAEGRPINFGYSVNWGEIRRRVMGDRWEALGSPSDERAILTQVDAGLREGALGVGATIGYAPQSGRSEYLELATLAANHDAPVFTHVRTKNTREPRGAIEGFLEVIAVAASTGAQMHICHINSSALRLTPRITRMIARAQSMGLPVTTEAYPWGAGSTGIGAPFLAPENLPLLGIAPSDILYLPTNERPRTSARLAALRRQDPRGRAIIHYLDEARPADAAMIEQAVAFRNGMIASDAIPFTVNGVPVTAARWPLPANAVAHPRSAATFTKVLGDYVRERRLMTLPEAIRRSSYLPARLLERVAPAMRRKGRIQAGSDADIIIFDPTTVAGRATYADPRRPATGMRHVLVNGQFVIRAGILQQRARPGAPVRAGGPRRSDRASTGVTR